MNQQSTETFSFKDRAASIARLKSETFDLLIIGGGITGASTARDAASRGLKVALLERKDFAYGTSSRSSKLIHGGLRYLENFEFGLVFEALAERALLLRTTPHMVRPLPFFLPVYRGDPNGRGILSMGLWLYDLLALFRTPGFHQRLSRKKLLQSIPFLKSEGLQGGFRYFDASMWDDVLAVQVLRSAHQMGSAVVNYVEAVAPVWTGPRITGYKARDTEDPSSPEFEIRAKKTILCAGPWTDEVGSKLKTGWKPWLNPSKGVHLVFDLKRIPMPGAMVMSHPEDGRISFVIPRPDFGAGVVIVGTTDGPTPAHPEEATIDPGDVTYLLELLGKYFPDLKITASDILSAYVGVRPLMGNTDGGGEVGSNTLQKVSREHHIGEGPGETVMVAGGKYTTSRKMGEQIVDFTLEAWKKKAPIPGAPEFPSNIRAPHTKDPVNPKAMPAEVERSKNAALKLGVTLPSELLSRYGAEAFDLVVNQAKLAEMEVPKFWKDRAAISRKEPDGFPLLEAQLRHTMRTEMVMHLEDFYLRRVQLYLSRADHGLPWAEELARVWADEKGVSGEEASRELARLKVEIGNRSAWTKNLK